MFFKTVFALYLAVITLAAPGHPPAQHGDHGCTPCSNSCPSITSNQTNVAINANVNVKDVVKDVNVLSNKGSD